jgi:uncharacterized protein (DUF1684 family)
MGASIILTVFLAITSLVAAADPSAGTYERTVTEWRAEHDEWLKAEDGWLTVVGLAWLKAGPNRVGSSPKADVSLPKSAPRRVGTITVKNNQARFIPARGARVTLNGKFAKATVLKPETGSGYDTVGIGSVKFFLIRREGKLAVRVKDNTSPARKQFTGSRWYPVDSTWRIQATFVPWDKPHPLVFDTAVGVKEPNQSPGYVRFERNGREFRLEPVIDENELRFVIRDETSGKTTYAASRFLYADLPKNGLHASGPIELDFNRAENPPCVFTEFATCPLPPPQNRLAMPVTAGEQMYLSRPAGPSPN